MVKYIKKCDGCDTRVEYRNHAKISLTTNASQFNNLKEDMQELIENCNLSYPQLSLIFHLSNNELENLVSCKANSTQNYDEKIQLKKDMLMFGFELDAKERAVLLMNNLITDYLFSTETLSKIIKVTEEELIAFRQNQIIDRTVEIKICVNIVMLHFVLRV
ncbi:HTH domain-containing protein [Lysinibacillus sp. NPDC097195]|uniref:HTH domain-containing protein n=1 Tax=Lysinibacillus sp. NPDC097195 TaxID=3364141 RepID=UPI00382AF4EE